MTLPNPTPSKFRLFIATAFDRNNIATASFLGGAAIAGVGAEYVGRSFDIVGVGVLVFGALLALFGYLLGQE